MVVAVAHHLSVFQDEVERAEQKEQQALRKLEQAEEDVKGGWARAAELERIAVTSGVGIPEWEKKLEKVQDLIAAQHTAQDELVIVRRELQGAMKRLEVATNNQKKSFWIESWKSVFSLNGGTSKETAAKTSKKKVQANDKTNKDGFVADSAELTMAESLESLNTTTKLVDGILSASGDVADMMRSYVPVQPIHPTDLFIEKASRNCCRAMDEIIEMAETMYPSYNDKEQPRGPQRRRRQGRRRQYSCSIFDDLRDEDESDSGRSSCTPYAAEPDSGYTSRVEHISTRDG